MTFKEVLLYDFDEFVSYRKSAGFSVDTYKSSVPPFLRFCGDYYPRGTVITEEMISAWFARNTYSINSKATFISMMRRYTQFRMFLGKDDVFLDEDYSINRTSYVPFMFKDDELSTFFDAIDNYTGTGSGKKLMPELVLPVYTRFLYCCGMRPQEPPSLLAEDVNLETGDIYIRKAKRHKDRHLIISEDMRTLCKAYDSLAGRRKWFFQRPDGVPYDRKWYYRAFISIWNKCSFDRSEKPRPYDLRHAFASRSILRWVESGKDVTEMLTYLSAYMGHAEITSTLYYVHLLPHNLRKAVKVDWNLLASVYEDGGDLHED